MGCDVVFFLDLLTRTETNLQIIPIALSDAIILYTTLIATLGNLWGYWYIILKVRAIYCNHEYYGLIHLIILYLLLNICFPCLYPFPAHKTRNNTEEAPFGIRTVST